MSPIKDVKNVVNSKLNCTIFHSTSGPLGVNCVGWSMDDGVNPRISNVS